MNVYSVVDQMLAPVRGPVLDVGEGQFYRLSTYSSWPAMKRMKVAVRVRCLPFGLASPEGRICGVASPTEGQFWSSEVAPVASYPGAVQRNCLMRLSILPLTCPARQPLLIQL